MLLLCCAAGSPAHHLPGVSVHILPGSIRFDIISQCKVLILSGKDVVRAPKISKTGDGQPPREDRSIEFDIRVKWNENHVASRVMHWERSERVLPEVGGRGQRAP